MADICGAIDRRGWVCYRPAKHVEKNHRYLNPSLLHRPPKRAWEPITSFLAWNEKRTRQYAVKVNGPCSLFVESGNNKHGYKVVSAECHAETGKVNVEILKTGDTRSRVVPSDRIMYKRK